MSSDDHTGPDGWIFMWARWGGGGRGGSRGWWEEAWRSLEPGSEPCRKPWSSLPASPLTSPQTSPMSGQCVVTGNLVATRPAQGTAKGSEAGQRQWSGGGGGVHLGRGSQK